RSDSSNASGSMTFRALRPFDCTIWMIIWHLNGAVVHGSVSLVARPSTLRSGASCSCCVVSFRAGFVLAGLSPWFPRAAADIPGLGPSALVAMHNLSWLGSRTDILTL